MEGQCHVAMPPTGVEDATQTSITWAKSPMNMCMHKISETEYLNKALNKNMHT